MQLTSGEGETPLRPRSAVSLIPWTAFPVRHRVMASLKFSEHMLLKVCLPLHVVFICLRGYTCTYVCVLLGRRSIHCGGLLRVEGLSSDPHFSIYVL